MKPNRFSRADGRRYWLKGKVVRFLGLQDAPGFAFVAHVHADTFFGVRLKVLSRCPRA